MFLLPFVILFALLIAFFLYKHYKVEIDRARLLKKEKDQIPFIQDSAKELSQLLITLTGSEQQKLYKYCVIFIHEKKWSNNISQQQRAQEAIKACLPIFRKKTNFYPQLHEIDSTRTFQQWLNLHRRQFEIELGKDQLLHFNNNFAQKSEEYFISPQKLNEESKQIFDLLHRYYSPQ